MNAIGANGGLCAHPFLRSDLCSASSSLGIVNPLDPEHQI